MPYSEKQRRFFGAELGRKRRGEKTETSATEEQMRDLARKPVHRGHKREKRRSKRRSGR